LLSKAYLKYIELLDNYILLAAFFQDLPYCEDVIHCGTFFTEATLIFTYYVLTKRFNILGKDGGENLAGDRRDMHL
jgi:hypothetical protein